ncbi:hypothetical protein CDIK_2094 [Cucumispora dikerogammari]|nr:hypothetical protein CDIK_2094 [Cucumispora dikerogammari]
MEEMVKRNLEKGSKCLHAIRPFLLNRSFSIHFRAKALKGILLPILLYGSELFGMSTKRLSKVQTLLNSACRSVLRTGRNTPTKLCNINLGIKPIDLLAARNRIRGLNKWKEAKTPIRDLIRNPLVNRRSTWVSGGNRWKRRSLKDEGLTITEALETEFTNRKIVAKTMTLAEKDNEESGVNISYPAIKYSLLYPDSKIGLGFLIDIRIGKLQPAWRLANTGLISKDYRNSYPCCKEKVKEDWVHVIFRCPEWSMYRKHLWSVAGLATNPPYDDNALVVAMKGLFGEELNSRTVLDDTSPGIIKMHATVKYLTVVIPLRAVIISRLRSEQLAVSRSRSPKNMATLGESKSLQGEQFSG